MPPLSAHLVYVGAKLLLNWRVVMRKLYGYHYSKLKLSELTTRRMRGELTEEEMVEFDDYALKVNSAGDVYRSVSLFLRPLPDDFILRIGDDFKRWRRRSVWYEHKVLINDTDPFSYRLASVKEELDLIDTLFDKDDPTPTSDSKLREFYTSLRELSIIGTDKEVMLDMVSNITDREVTDGINLMRTRGNRYQYATTIPHLQVYTNIGIPVESVRRYKV